MKNEMKILTPQEIHAAEAKDLLVTAMVHVYGGQECMITGEMLLDIEWEQFYPELEKEHGKTFNALDAQGKCQCCNRRISWICHGVYKPTNTPFVMGRQCAKSMQAAGYDKVSMNQKRMADKVKRKRKALKFIEGLSESDREILEWMKTAKNRIAKDMSAKLERFGSLSEKQIAFAHKLREQETAREQELQNANPIIEGRQVIVGEIVSVKCRDDGYNQSWKATIKDEQGNLFWGTLPSAIKTECKGERIELTGTVRPSDNDPHFGFYSRPSKAKLIA